MAHGYHVWEYCCAPAADALTEQQIIDAMAAAGYRFVPSTETEETEA